MTEKIAAFVKEKGGAPGQIERWGRRNFAYELSHRTEGYYVLIEVVAEPTVLADVDRMLALSDDVLRHRVIRQPERTKVSTEAPPLVVPASAAAE